MLCCFKNALKLAFVHLELQPFFQMLYGTPGLPGEEVESGTRNGEEEERKGKGMEKGER